MSNFLQETYNRFPEAAEDGSYLNIVKRIIDDFNITTINQEFYKKEDGSLISNPRNWLINLFDSGFYYIDNNEGDKIHFHNKRLIDFLDWYTKLELKSFDECMLDDKPFIIEMGLHPHSENVDCIDFDFISPLLDSNKELHTRLVKGTAYLFLYFGWEADNFCTDGYSNFNDKDKVKKGNYPSYHHVFSYLMNKYELPGDSIIVLNSNLVGDYQEEQQIHHFEGKHAKVIYESAVELDTFKSIKGNWKPNYTFDDYIKNIKKSKYKVLRVNRTHLISRDMMLYFLYNSGMINEALIEHKEIDTNYLPAVQVYFDKCYQIAKNLDLEVARYLKYDSSKLKKLLKLLPFIASNHEESGELPIQGLYSNETIPYDIYENSIFSWVSTSLYSRIDQVFINGSTFNPILHYHPIVWASNPMNLYFFKKKGFKSYYWFCEEELQDIQLTEQERLVLSINEIYKLLKKDKQELINLIIENRDKLEHNRKLLFECRSIENIIKKLFYIIHQKYEGKKLI